MTLAVPRSMPIFMTGGDATPGAARRAVTAALRWGWGGRGSGRVGRADDAGAQLLELAVDVLIPPLDVVRAVEERRPVGREGGQDERGAGPQVADRGLAPVERRRAVDRRPVGVEDVDPRPELAQLGEPLDPVLEDR